jgi:DNA-binding transcriptional regulator/RsmH inhibitor MraZ
MFTIEFQAKIDNGAIEVPERFRDRLKGSVRVIVFGEVESSTGSMIDELLARPLQIPDFRPLTRNEIYARD